MDFSAHLNASAVWLNEYALALTTLMALTALVVEITNRSLQARRSSTVNSEWTRTWLTNVGLLVCAMGVSWVLAPWLSPAFSAVLSGDAGLLAWLDVASVSYVGYVLLGVLLLDLLSYVLHRVFHQVPLLWRLHQVHHSDSAVNASTHFRQHPVQHVLLPLIQLPLLWMLGISGVSWLLYAALSTAAQLCQHAEAGRSTRVDRWLGVVLITPLAHLTHHDQRKEFHDHNFGTLFSFWDRLLGTYIKAPSKFHLGLPGDRSGQRSKNFVSLFECLHMPFKSSVTPALSRGPTPFRTHIQGKK